MSTANNSGDEKPLPHSMRTREPWPMWPIALAIVLFIGVYTWVNLEFRKEGKAFEPFQAMMDRKNAIVEKNFYDWYSIKARRIESNVQIATPANATSRVHERALDEVIPEQLKYYMPGKPVLVPGFVKTECPDSLTPGIDLPIRLFVPKALAADERLHLLTFYKEGDLYLLATLFVEKLEDLPSQFFDGAPTPVSFSISTDPIEAEQIHVRFLNADRLSEWKIANLDPSAAVLDDKIASE